MLSQLVLVRLKTVQREGNDGHTPSAIGLAVWLATTCAAARTLLPNAPAENTVLTL